MVDLTVRHPRGVVEGELTATLEPSSGAPEVSYYPADSPRLLRSRGDSSDFRAVFVIPRYAAATVFDVVVVYSSARGHHA